MMPFYPVPLPVPLQTTTSRLHLEPLSPAHTERDFEALMQSREMLRLWSGSSWPADDFSLDANRADLAWHADEHARRIAFTYTVLTPDLHTCLGCVYIRPLWEMGIGGTSAETHASVTRFWITQPWIATGLEQELLHVLMNWFRSDAWQFERVCFHTPTAHARQVALLERAGLVDLGRVNLPDRGGEHSVYEMI